MKKIIIFLFIYIVISPLMTTAISFQMSEEKKAKLKACGYDNNYSVCQSEQKKLFSNNCDNTCVQRSICSECYNHAVNYFHKTNNVLGNYKTTCGKVNMSNEPESLQQAINDCLAGVDNNVHSNTDEDTVVPTSDDANEPQWSEEKCGAEYVELNRRVDEFAKMCPNY